MKASLLSLGNCDEPNNVTYYRQKNQLIFKIWWSIDNKNDSLSSPNMCHVCLVYAGLKCVCRILCWNRSCLIRLWVHPVLSSHPGREGIERGHDYFGIRLQSVCAFACACAFWTQMLSVLPLGEMGQLKVIAVCMSVCMSLCQTWVCPSTTGGVCLGLNWICWRLLSFHFNITFYIIANYELRLS